MKLFISFILISVITSFAFANDYSSSQKNLHLASYEEFSKGVVYSGVRLYKVTDEILTNVVCEKSPQFKCYVKVPVSIPNGFLATVTASYAVKNTPDYLISFTCTSDNYEVSIIGANQKEITENFAKEQLSKFIKQNSICKYDYLFKAY